MEDKSQSYGKIWLSEFFHSFPHLNRHMEKVSSKFEPDDQEYLEALAFWALIPAAFCIALWLFYFIYFICRCCEKPDNSKRVPSICPRVTTGLFIFFGVGLLSFGLYENEEAHRGVDEFRDAVIDINKTAGGAKARVDSLNALAEDVSGRLSNSIVQAIENYPDPSVTKHVMNLVSKIETQADVARDQLDRVDVTDEFDYLDDIIMYSDEVEYYRWMGSVIIHSLYIFIFFLILIGLLVRSRSLLIVSTTLCIFCFLFLWASAGVHLGTSVGLGDFCVDPNSFLIGLADDKAGQAVLKSYVECTNSTEPYGDEIQKAQKSLTQAQLSLDSIENFVKPYDIKGLKAPLAELKLEIGYCLANLSMLLDNVGFCAVMHGEYMEALDGACIDTITSTAWLTLTNCVVGLMCVLAIISNSMLWRQYARKRHPTNHGLVDDTDPFLPRPPPYESDYGAMGYSSPTPWSERGTLQRFTDSPFSDESLMMLPHNQQRQAGPLPVDESPPPAYHPGRFVRQYADSDNN